MSSSSSRMMILSLISSRSEGMLSFLSVTSRSSPLSLPSSSSHSLTNLRSPSCAWTTSLSRMFSSQMLQSSALMLFNSPEQELIYCPSAHSPAVSPPSNDIIFMSLLRRAEVSIMAFLLKNRTVRLAKKRAEFLKKVSISVLFTMVWHQCEFRENRMISANEELSKPYSFFIEGVDPFKMSREDWDIVQNHYMSFYYR